MANNYYEWLGLPVENFENDPTVLSEIVEKKIVEWQSHKKLEITNRAYIHGPQIRAAIRNPEMWEEIYREYKEQVDDNIADQLQLFVNDKLEIAAEDVETIAKQNSVSARYVKQICNSLKYKVGGSSAVPVPEYTIENMEPTSFRKFSSVQKLIEELGSKNLMELLARTDVLGVAIGANSPNAKVIETLEQVHKKWMNVSATGDKATQKSHLDKIYSGFTKHLKTIPFSEYIDCLKYSKAKEALSELTALKVRELSEIAFNTKVSQLFEFTEDQNKARSILAAFCSSKGIGYPLPRAMLAMCPFCGNNFERTEPIQKNCPVCGHSLMVQCPKCKKLRHIIIEPECDGINIGSFPLLEKTLESINKDCDVLSLESARDKLNDLKSRWNGFPGADKAEERLSKLEREYGLDIAKIAEHCRRNELYSARGIIDRIDRSFPGFKRGYGNVYSSVEYAENEFAEAVKNPNVSARINLLLAINDIVADFPKLNTELQKYPISPVTDLRADMDSNAGIVTLSWHSENKPNSVFYVIRRKTDTPVANAADGNEIARTQMLSFGDNTIREGVVYYYAVYAVRGPIVSAMATMTEPGTGVIPVIALKKPNVTITPRDRSIDLSWGADNGKMRVFSSDKEITQYDEGTPVSNLLPSGALIEGLTNDKPYWIAVYKYVLCGGKEYRSRLAIYPQITPIVPVSPPRFRISRGNKDGEYILRDESESSGDIVLFYSETRVGISENAAISFSEMESKAKRLDASKLADGSFMVDMAGRKTMLVYPAIVMSGSLMVGNILTLQYIKQSDVDVSVSGSSLCIMLHEFPEGMDQIIICYNFDGYPMDSTDCERGHRISVSKVNYLRDKIVRIPNVKQGDYYISVFAKSGRDEMLIANKLAKLAKTATIVYSMTKTLSGVNITLKSENSTSRYIPPLTFAYAEGAVPLSKENAAGYAELPEIPNARRSELIAVKCKLPKNAYGKVFCADSRYSLIAEGSMKLN
ncbi:MAG: hypothetical protein K2N06_05065 [Oscillospiraceae bacterium]|nr:hypothetical protein [Oscillospiraceae bacterium]